MRKTIAPLQLRGGHGSAVGTAGTGSDASRRLSNVSNASTASNDGDTTAAVARFSWHSDPDKTRVLLRLVNDTVAHKPEDQRRVTTSEWEVVLDAFNRQVSPPAESARVLHNRFTNLRLQCKDYHHVVVAQRKGLLADVDAWVLFLKINPTLRKWRKKPFEFYDDMMESLRLQGEDLDNLPPPPVELDDMNDDDGMNDDDANTTNHANNSNHANNANTARRQKAVVPTATTKRRRTAASTTMAPPPVPSAPLPRAVANAPGGIVSISHYPAALRHLGPLALSLEDRVDAKRFLVADANAQAFIYMDDAERRFFLQKYCFDRRDQQRQDATSGGSDAALASPPSP